MTSKAALAADINAVARLKGSFRLRSGTMAAEYFDKYRFESDPLLLRRIAREMIGLIPKGTEILAGLELGGVPIATAMSLESGLPTVFVRKEAKKYGTCQAIEGRSVDGARIAIVEDVISTGGMVIQSAKMLGEADAILTGVLCAIWRAPGAPYLAELGDVPVFAALTAKQLG